MQGPCHALHCKLHVPKLSSIIYHLSPLLIALSLLLSQRLVALLKHMIYPSLSLSFSIALHLSHGLHDLCKRFDYLCTCVSTSK
eukprot:c31234_g1_i1 orf=2-250(-)